MQTLRNVILIAALSSLIGFGFAKFVFVGKNIPFAGQKAVTRTLDKYSIENLSKTDIKPGRLTLDRQKGVFNLDFEPALDGKIASTSGQIKIPAGNGKYPLVVMIRGYVDKEIYKTGVGTEPAAKVFSQNGYITIAPDFLGYGNSSPETADLFEARFQTYTTVLALLKSVDQIGEWDHKNLFIWAHSNGGQIALAILEITGAKYPTTLWAPVSSPFPYSILYYEDELSDYGKFLRSELAKFEAVYAADKYSVTSYLNLIQAPIQLHQGTADAEVPVKWSDSLAKSLKDKKLQVNYYIYLDTDHNMKPSWNLVVQRDLSFFNDSLEVSPR